MLKLWQCAPQSWEEELHGFHHLEDQTIEVLNFSVFLVMWITHALLKNRCLSPSKNLLIGTVVVLLVDGITSKLLFLEDQVLDYFLKSFAKMSWWISMLWDNLKVVWEQLQLLWWTIKLMWSNRFSDYLSSINMKVVGSVHLVEKELLGWQICSKEWKSERLITQKLICFRNWQSKLKVIQFVHWEMLQPGLFKAWLSISGMKYRIGLMPTMPSTPKYQQTPVHIFLSAIIDSNEMTQI